METFVQRQKGWQKTGKTSRVRNVGEKPEKTSRGKDGREDETEKVSKWNDFETNAGIFGLTRSHDRVFHAMGLTGKNPINHLKQT